MKKKDYIMLARRSIKIHKESNRSTILGMIFGLILLVPMFTAIFGINFSMNNQMSSTPYHLNYNVGMADYRINTDDYYKNDNGTLEKNWSGSKNLDLLMADKSVEDKIVYEQYDFRGGDSESYSIAGGEKVTAPSQPFNYFSIVDTDKSNCIFPKNLTESFEGGIFMAGYDKGFTDKGKKEVVLSENLLKLYELSPDDVYMKPWSFSSYIYINEEKDDVYLCQNYNVVGIIKSEVSSIYSEWTLMSANMFFTSVNVYDENGNGVLKPINTVLADGRTDTHYPNLDKKDELNKEYMMLSSWRDTFGGINNTTYGSTRIFFGATSFAKLNGSMTKTEGIAKKSLGNTASSPVNSSNLIGRYKLIYRLLNIVSIICIIVGTVMLCSALISFYSSIHHSVSQRKYYLTMLRAIGARDNVIPKLYLAESLIIASRANFFVLILGIAMSSAVKVVLDMVLKINGVAIAVAISWTAVVVGALVAVVLLYTLTMLFAYICTRKLVKRKITEVLNNK